MLHYIEFYGDGLGRDVTSADSPTKAKESQEIDPSGEGSNGFERVCVAPDRVGPQKRPSMIHDSAFFFNIFFFKILAPTVRIPLFKRTAHTHTEKWTHFRYIKYMIII